MENYKIGITETVKGYIKVNAKNQDHALDMVREMLDCDYVVDIPNI